MTGIETNFEDKVLNAYSTITGLNRGIVENIVCICGFFDLDLESVVARIPDIRQYTDPRKLEDKLFAEIVNMLVALVNEDFANHLGVSPNIVTGKTNTFKVWFEFDENADDTALCLAIKKNPEVLKQLHPRSRFLVFHSSDVEKILSDIDKKLAQKYFEDKTGQSC